MIRMKMNTFAIYVWLLLYEPLNKDKTMQDDILPGFIVRNCFMWAAVDSAYTWMITQHVGNNNTIIKT